MSVSGNLDISSRLAGHSLLIICMLLHITPYNFEIDK